MVAATYGHTEIVVALLQRGAAVDVVGKDGNTALILTAGIYGNAECARLLLEAGADATLQIQWQDCPRGGGGEGPHGGRGAAAAVGAA